jgi:hypothetical protein
MFHQSPTRWSAIVLGLSLLIPVAVAADPIQFTDAGAAAADIQDTVNAFRAALGEPNNGNAPGPIVGGRREINWDGGGAVTPSVTAGPLLTAFQNTRGATFTTPGTQFAQASPDDLASAALLGQPSYSAEFDTVFSLERLFTPFGSNITDATFSIPGSGGTASALIKGFGAVFADVDVPNATSIQFFDASDMLIGSIFAPVSNGGLSFAGVLFDAGETIARVRLTTGTALPGAVDGTSSDVVFMDDFLYSEPIPEPATLLLTGLGLAGVCGRALRRRKG